METLIISQDTYSYDKETAYYGQSEEDKRRRQEIQALIDVRVNSLDSKKTQYAQATDFFDKKLKPLFQQRPKNGLNYICQSMNWIGYVTEIREDSFTARLTDTSNDTTDEIADFDLQDVSKDDLSLLTLGATFYWSVGYAYQYGQVIKQSFIRFKRSMDLSVQEFDTIMDEVKQLKDNIVWE